MRMTAKVTALSLSKAMAFLVSFLLAFAVPAVRAQDDAEGLPKGAKLIADNLKFAEGPLIDRKGVLYFSAVNESKIYKWDGSKQSVFYDGPDGPNGLAMSKDGTIYAAAGKGKAILKITSDGKATKWLTQIDGKPLNSPNDLVIDAKGNIFFTNPAGMTPPGDKSGVTTSVVRVRPDGTAKVVSTDLSYPNGIGLSPDGKTLYVDDLLSGSLLYKFPLTGDGEVGKGEVLVKFGAGMPDGLKVAASGNVYVALNLGAKIVKVAPDGKILGEIKFPKGSGVSNLCFGGDDMKTLYVTLGRGKVYMMPIDEPGLKLASHQ